MMNALIAHSKDHEPPAHGLRFWGIVLFFTMLYWIGAQIGLFLRTSFGDVTPIWPPSGLAVALFLAWGPRYWPIIAFGEFTIALSIHQPPTAGLAGACAQIFEAWIAFALLRNRGVMDITSSSTSVLRFALMGVVVPPLAASLIGTTSLLSVGVLTRETAASGFLTWWMGDAIGILVLTPFLTKLLKEQRIPFGRGTALQFAVSILVMTAIGILIAGRFDPRTEYLFFLLLPLVVIATIQFGLTGAGSSALALTAVAFGLHPHHDQHASDFLTAVRMLFVGISAFTGYLVAGFLRERAAAEARLREMSIAVQKASKLQALGTMAGGIAHDFNNIIASIKGYADLALSHENGERPALNHDVKQIQKACVRATDLVRQILSFSEKSDAPAKTIDILPAVQEAVQLFQSMLPNGAHLEIHLDAGNACVRCNPTQIHQILMNLLTNALHALPNGSGRIVLRVEQRCVDQRPRHSREGPIGDFIVLIVQDNGIGMSPDVCEKIFEPYFTTKSPGRGTGLGLTVVQGIVNQLQGFIEIASKTGVGTTVSIYLPAAHAPCNASLVAA